MNLAMILKYMNVIQEYKRLAFAKMFFSIFKHNLEVAIHYNLLFLATIM